MIENGIARFEIAQKIDEGNVIGLGARERAHDEVEIGGSKPRPTIRSDHRELVMRKARVYGKPNRHRNEARKWDRCSLATAAVVRGSRIHEHRFTRIAQQPRKSGRES